MRKILIVGATSGMAEACARLWAQRGDHLFLAARNSSQLQSVCDDLRARGATRVGHQVFDANDLGAHAALLSEATQTLGGLDTVLIAHGTLSDQERAQQDVAYALQEMASRSAVLTPDLSALATRYLRQMGPVVPEVSQ